MGQLLGSKGAKRVSYRIQSSPPESFTIEKKSSNFQLRFKSTNLSYFRIENLNKRVDFLLVYNKE